MQRHQILSDAEYMLDDTAIGQTSSFERPL